jgi:hypothetical protein
LNRWSARWRDFFEFFGACGFGDWGGCGCEAGAEIFYGLFEGVDAAD